ncbi:MAG: rhodanese-like domain-containing protein [Rhodobacteraceae bacterium]|nr:MAG: rhodanese-like domain-containing protein [Paracoccaceae bacterium]
MLKLLPAIALLLLSLQPASAQQIYTAQPSAQQLQEAPVLLVDIRRPEEWVETGVLPNALLLTFESPAQFLTDLRPHLQPGQPVALICRTGNRTARAAHLIAADLDVPVVDVAGGIFRLMGAGYRPDRPTSAQGCTIC